MKWVYDHCEECCSFLIIEKRCLHGVDEFFFSISVERERGIFFPAFFSFAMSF